MPSIFTILASEGCQAHDGPCPFPPGPWRVYTRQQAKPRTLPAPRPCRSQAWASGVEQAQICQLQVNAARWWAAAARARQVAVGGTSETDPPWPPPPAQRMPAGPPRLQGATRFQTCAGSRFPARQPAPTWEGVLSPPSGPPSRRGTAFRPSKGGGASVHKALVLRALTFPQPFTRYRRALLGPCRGSVSNAGGSGEAWALKPDTGRPRSGGTTGSVLVSGTVKGLHIQ